jgi:tRNA (cytidine/uridine-2'-O-)-methyltransferase
MINIILHEPEIPQNTGNIARTCAATGASLHLIKPMGFTVDDKKLKRAGLDYWDKLDITYYDGFDDFLSKHPDADIYYFSTKAPNTYAEVSYPDDVYIMFGKESRGLPEELLHENKDKCVRIPMRDSLRSLNLSNSVAIAVYEILRQKNFEGMQTETVTTEMLGMPRLVEEHFENPDGSPVRVDADMLGNVRGTNPTAGPIEGLKAGKNRIKIWDK